MSQKLTNLKKSLNEFKDSTKSYATLTLPHGQKHYMDQVSTMLFGVVNDLSEVVDEICEELGIEVIDDDKKEKT